MRSASFSLETTSITYGIVRMSVAPFTVPFAFCGEDCRDFDFNCRDWVSASAKSCFSTDYIKRSCRRSCGFCGSLAAILSVILDYKIVKIMGKFFVLK
uniref:ShKT domain-containing protein n=1 Tax=Heterorhabditis bacteriophora TaxID=37862 RepID=A0A1I7X3K7_HETBA